MKYRITLDRAFVNCTVVTRDYGGEQLHLITPTGVFAPAHRIPVYTETLAAHPSANYFYILDNRGGHEIQLSPEDMSYFNDMHFNAGIRYIRGGVVTTDEGYGLLISMANAKAKAKNFEVDLLSTQDFQEAEEFVLSKLMEALKSQSPGSGGN